MIFQSITKKNKSVILLLLSSLFLISCISPINEKPQKNQATHYSYQIINRYPHDRKALTQGLIFNQGFLYESTGLFRHSSLRQVDLTSGRVVQKKALDNHLFAEGLTLWKNQLIQLTWKSGQAFVYDAQTLHHLSTFYYNTEGWGLTHNEQHLIMSDGSATLYFRDPTTFKVVKTLQVIDDKLQPVDKLNELEFIQGYIYANIWPKSKIAIIHPHTGRITGWINLKNLKLNETGNTLNGIAYDKLNKKLYVTGKRWRWIYEIALIPEKP